MLVVAVSSRALFNLEDGQHIFETQGPEAFDAYMRDNEKKPLRPGVAFHLIQRLLAFNSPGTRDKVDVMLLSSNSLEAGARVMNSVRHHNLDIERAFFTSGRERFAIAKAGKVTLFLSTNPNEVRRALSYGIASASILPNSRLPDEAPGLRVAFDGDAVLFSDDAERVSQAEGVEAFQRSEQRKAKVPLPAGPFKPVLQALREIQNTFEGEGACPLRLALVTARGVPAYARVLNTLRAWDLQVDEYFFLGGLPKGPFLEAFGAHLFFDDGWHNIESASQYVPAGHVPNGVLGLKPRPVPVVVG